MQIERYILYGFKIIDDISLYENYCVFTNCIGKD